MEDNELMVQEENGFKVDPKSGLIGAGLAIGGYLAYRGVRKLGRFVKSKICKGEIEIEYEEDIEPESEPEEVSSLESSEEK